MMRISLFWDISFTEIERSRAGGDINNALSLALKLISPPGFLRYLLATARRRYGAGVENRLVKSPKPGAEPGWFH